MAKWIVLLAIAAGIFYLGYKLMPNAHAIDGQWVYGQVREGMSAQEVLQIAGEPADRLRHQVGSSEAWFYNDRYDEKDRLVVHFIEGHVYKREFQDN